MNKIVETSAKVLSGVGALNWGIYTFVPQWNVLSFVPAGIFNTAVVAAITASGGYLIYLVYKKRI